MWNCVDLDADFYWKRLRADWSLTNLESRKVANDSARG